MHIMFKRKSLALPELLRAFESDLRQSDAADRTVASYLSDLRLFAAWLEGVIPGAAEDLDAFTLQRYRSHLDHTEKRATSTTNRKLQAIRRFCAWAYKTGEMLSNPALDVKLKPQPRIFQPRSLATPDIHKVLTIAGRGSHGPRNYALVQLMLQTGLRVGEVERLVVDDIAIHDRSGHVRVRDGKGRKERTVPLNASVRKALTAWLQERSLTVPQEPSVFVTTTGKGLKKRALQKVISELMTTAGCSASAHTLRHTFATRHYQDHGKLVELSGLLGHESLNTTARYTQPTHDDLARQLEKSSLNEFGD